MKKTSEIQAGIDNPNTFDELKEANSDDDISVDQEGWKQQKSSVRKRKSSKFYEPCIKCNNCNFKCKTEDELLKHTNGMHGSKTEQVWYKCDKCNLKYKSKDELQEHIQTKHPDEVKEAKSDDEISVDQDEGWKQKAFKCGKCDKEYLNMSKLRRHDWRCHRQIECNICGEKLDSRKDISVHRQSKHQMFKKIV